MTKREELIRLVESIVGCDASEKQVDAWLDELQSRVPHPAVTDLIYHQEEALSAEEIVDAALSYLPIPLSFP